MHEILAAAMFLEAHKDRGVRFFPNLTFENQKRHISGQIPGKIQVPLCQNLCFLSYRPQILAPALFFKAR